MFKKFHPKEDVSSSTSLKSSVQRSIRTALLEQYPLLSRPVPSSSGTTGNDTLPPGGSADTDAPPPDKDEVDDELREENVLKAGGKGRVKGGKGKGGKGKAKGKDKEEVDDEAGDGGAAAAGGAGGVGAGGAGEGERLVIDEIWPKKEALGLTKCHDRISIYTIHSTPIFFNHFDGPFVPTLKLLHQWPGLLEHVQIDRGAIKFLLAGANMMAPGFLSPGGRLPDGLAKDQLVAIHAEGKEHACGIGKMCASSAEIRQAGKGVAVEVVTWIGDDLWKVDSIGL